VLKHVARRSKADEAKPAAAARLDGYRLNLFTGIREIDHAEPNLNNRMQERRFKMNVRPLHDRIVIKRIEEKETVKGGIIIPDTAKEKPQEGEVVAVGKGKREKGELVALDVKVGDRILFGKYSGTEIKLEGEEYLIIREDEVLGVIEGAAKAAKK
jgi:chaperonin GroES